MADAPGLSRGADDVRVWYYGLAMPSAPSAAIQRGRGARPRPSRGGVRPSLPPRNPAAAPGHGGGGNRTSVPVLLGGSDPNGRPEGPDPSMTASTIQQLNRLLNNPNEVLEAVESAGIAEHACSAIGMVLSTVASSEVLKKRCVKAALEIMSRLLRGKAQVEIFTSVINRALVANSLNELPKPMMNPFVKTLLDRSVDLTVDALSQSYKVGMIKLILSVVLTHVCNQITSM